MSSEQSRTTLGSHLAELLSNASVYDLARPFFHGMPELPSMPPYFMSLFLRHGDMVLPDQTTGAAELMIMCGHHGTHIDGLGHVCFAGRMHGDRPMAQHQGLFGIRELGMESVPPLLCRGVLLDIPLLRPLKGGEAVTADDLEAVCRREGVEVRPGDAVLIRTGWGAYYGDPARYLSFTEGYPGPDGGAAKWLAAHRVRVTGADNISFEQSPPVPSALPAHVTLLVDHGIYIMENLDLEALAKDQVYTFAFCCLPLKLTGATGSPVRPVALV